MIVRIRHAAPPRIPDIIVVLLEIPTLFAAVLPLTVIAAFFLFCVYMVLKIALNRSKPTIIAIDSTGIVLEHPTAIIPRKRIPFDRVISIAPATPWLGIPPRFPSALRIALRDGFPTVIPVPAADLPAISAALNSILETLAPINAAPLQRLEFLHSTWLPLFESSNSPKDPLCARCDIYADGERWTITPGFVWMFANSAVAVVVTMIVLPAFNWLIAFPPQSMISAILLSIFFYHGLYFWPILSRRVRPPTRPPSVILDIIDGELCITDRDYRGPVRSWSRDQIAAFEIAGPLWWLARAGRLRMRLRNGNCITLLYGYPLRLLRPLALRLPIALANDPKSQELA